MSPGSAPAPSSAIARWGLPALLVVATVAAFLPVLSAGFVNWDDVAYIVNTPHWRGLSREHLAWMFTTTASGQYQPLAWLSLAIEHGWWGMDPRGYHLTNVLLHAANAVLLYGVIRVLGGGATLGDRVAAALGAAFFALHPLRVESVAWVTERREVLSTALLLATVLVYLRAVRSERARAWLHALAVALFALSLLAEAWGMTFAVVLFVVDVWVLDRPVTRGLLVEKLPYLALGLGCAVNALLAQRSADAMQGLADHGLAERVLQAGYGVCFYLVKTLLPVRLSPLYLMDEQRALWEMPQYVVATVVAITASVWMLLARRRVPALFAAWACYVVIISPVLGLVQVGVQAVADRYSYVACIPWAVLLGAALAVWLRTVRLGSWAGAGAVGAMILVLGGLGGLTARQATCWQDTLSLWDQAVRVQPDNYVARANRGNARLELARARGPVDAVSRALLAAAIADYDRAVALAPGFGYAHASRGLAYLTLGDYAEAVRSFDAALALVGPDPDVAHQRALAAQALAAASGRRE